LGFIGSNLAHTCLALGAEVTIYDCLDANSGGNMYNVFDIQDQVHFVKGDILHVDELSRQVRGKDIIFNCAASTSHPFSMRNPMLDLDANSKGVLNLLEAVKNFNKEAKFVHIGTSTQLGKSHYSPADELHPEFPTDIYSANKGVSEKYVLIYGNAYHIPVTIVRLPNVFGPRAAIHSSDFNFVNYFVGLALQGKDITVYGKGAQKRNLIYIDDCLAALVLASQNDKANGEVLFAVGDRHMAVLEIAHTIVEHIGSGRVKSIEWPLDRKVIEIGDAVLSNAKIKKTLDWVPQVDVEAGFKRTREYFQSCLEHYFEQRNTVTLTGR
ncbi:MAG: hypothetical protein A2787_02045, partial [Omnitrophica WOR_2 bacterium RIFCSPHIGHO2_01_FULL_48_9]